MKHRISFWMWAMAALTTISSVLVAWQAKAAPLTFTPEIDIPGLFSGVQKVDGSLIGRYIAAIFVYFIWIVGVIAVVMVIYGGVKWVAAAGNAARINDARDVINNAIIGVIIALTSVVLLNIINPQLTILTTAAIVTITPESLNKLNAQGCIEHLTCARLGEGYEQTKAAFCTDGNFGFNAGVFTYVNPGEDYCSVGRGICCWDAASHQLCVGIDGKNGSTIRDSCGTPNFVEYTYCEDQTACGDHKTVSTDSQGIVHKCEGVYCANNGICNLNHTDWRGAANGDCTTPSKNSDHVDWTTMTQNGNQCAGKLYYSDQYDCGSLQPTVSGAHQTYENVSGAKPGSCPAGQFCMAEFPYKCENGTIYRRPGDSFSACVPYSSVHSPFIPES